MKGSIILSHVLSACLGVVIGYFLFSGCSDVSQEEIDKKHAAIDAQNDSLQSVIDSLDIYFLEKDTIISYLRSRLESLHNESNTIHTHHEESRILITVANDSQLVRIITGQHPPEGY